MLTYTPAGIEHWFDEALERAPNDVEVEECLTTSPEVAARYVAAAPRYGLKVV